MLKFIKNHKKAIIASICIVIGVVCIGFTTVVIFLNQTNSSYIIDGYNAGVKKLSDTEIKEKESKAKDYNKALKDLQDNGNYNEKAIKGRYDVLQLGDVLSYIDIPSIDVYLPIYEGTTDEILQVGVGHQKGTSLPVGGKGTNCVLLGHSGLRTNPLFTDVLNMNKGDMIYLHTLNKKYSYKVSNIYTILPDELDNYTTIDENKDEITLVTCTPVGINTHRFVVQADRVKTQIVKNSKDYSEKENKNSTENIKNTWSWIIYIIVAVILIIVLLVFVLLRNRRKENEGKKK